LQELDACKKYVFYSNLCILSFTKLNVAHQIGKLFRMRWTRPWSSWVWDLCNKQWIWCIVVF